MNETLKIPNTLELICACWNQAEESLQADIKDNCPDINEEAVTQNFHAKLSECLRFVSERGLVESTFLSDLERSFSSLQYEHSIDLQRISQGLIADVTLHNRKTEGVTGGDLGLMIIRPQVTLWFSELRISDYRRGILAQAKLKRRNGQWGEFTRIQKQVLPSRLPYLTLLLYRYDDDARRNLSRFGWQLCDGATFDEVEAWLRENTFPNKLESCEIIKRLGNAAIGTSNNEILDELISPKKNQSLIIRIYWPDGKYPGSEIRIYTQHEAEQKAQILLRH